MIRLTYEGLNKVGTDEWKMNIEHAKKTEDYYWDVDNLILLSLLDMIIGNFMIWGIYVSIFK